MDKKERIELVLLRHKQDAVTTDKAVKDILHLFSVGQQRELLNALADSIEKEFETYAYLPDLIEHIKAFNCG